MTDWVVLAAVVTACVAGMMFISGWFRHAADLVWMAVLRPWTALGAFVAVSAFVNWLAGYALAGSGFVSTRFAIALLLAPVPTRFIVDWLSWIRIPHAERAVFRVGVTFDLIQEHRRTDFMATLDQQSDTGSNSASDAATPQPGL